jgi:hypothetical protein
VVAASGVTGAREGGCSSRVVYGTGTIGEGAAAAVRGDHLGSEGVHSRAGGALVGGEDTAISACIPVLPHRRIAQSQHPRPVCVTERAPTSIRLMSEVRYWTRSPQSSAFEATLVEATRLA